MEYLILLLLIVEIIFLTILDRILYGTYITPVTVLSIPYLVIVVLAILFAQKLGFLPFNFNSLWIWIIGLPIFWIPSCILSPIFLGKTNVKNYPYSVSENPKLEKLIVAISYLIIIVLFFGFMKSLGKSRIATEEFGNVFGTGISGHVSLISKLFYIYLIVVFRKKYLVPILLLSLFYLSYGSKTWVLLPFFAAIISRVLLKKISLKLSLILKLLFFGMFVFYIVYRIALGSEVDFSYIYLHFLKYVFAGVLGLSQYTSHSGAVGIEPNYLINPIINIINLATHSKLQALPSNVMTYVGLNFYPNVKTFFGTIYLYGGIGWGIFFTFLFGMVSYLFLVISIKTKELIYLIVYALFLTSLLYGWFDIHFNNLFFYELPVFSILFVIIYPTLIRLRVKSKKVMIK
jgi:oligosaccharide repeat unit polymerase